MANSAVPQYLGRDFKETPPGHRFTLYGAFWEPEQDWQRIENIAPASLKRDFGQLTPDTVKLRDALCSRQQHVASALSEAIWFASAQSIAPFVTGTGIEHPLENGMAFLNPYGLPYLPGSGVKGVVRRAAEALRDDIFGEGTQDWDQTAIDSLFGKETESGDTDTEHTRGALTFWDVVPQCDRLAVDIMNPHYGDYYQGNTTPHDSGQPVPIFFLTVPANTPFTFYVQCDRGRLPKDWPIDHWRLLLDAAFAHAFDWLGFGAKTGVGYGAMKRNLEQEAKIRKEAEEQQRQASEAALTPEQRNVVELRRWLDEDQIARCKEPGGRLANRLNELLKEGLAWQTPERESLAALAEEIYGYLDWGNSKKKQERKAKIQKLREGASS